MKELRAFPGGCSDGMTLRDYFAAKALQGLLACPNVESENSSFEVFPKWAYHYADGMIEARDK